MSTLVSSTGAAGAAVTLTLPAAGAGTSHKVSTIELVMYSTAARTGVAAPVVVTTTNLPGSPAFTFPTAGAIGTAERRFFNFIPPLDTVAMNTATTVVCPATTSVIWRVTVVYDVAGS